LLVKKYQTSLTGFNEKILWLYTHGLSTRDIQAQFEEVDATERLTWAKNSLDALAGKREVFISWRLGHASTFDGDILLVFFH
jgi:hypothetical protein